MKRATPCTVQPDVHCRVSTTLALLTPTLLACGGPTAVVVPDAPPTAAVSRPLAAPPPFHDGERAEYAVSVLGIPAATGSIDIDAGGRGWVVEANARALAWLETFYPLRLRMRATVRDGSWKPVRLLRDGVNGSRKYWREVHYKKRGKARVATRKDGGKLRRRTRRTMPDTHDPMGVLLAMRQAAADGRIDGTAWYSFDGLWTRRLSVRADGVETIEVPAGSFRCRKMRVRIQRVQVPKDWRIPSRREDHTWTVWISDDSRLLPIQAEGPSPFGPSKMVLTTRAAPAIASAR